MMPDREQLFEWLDQLSDGDLSSVDSQALHDSVCSDPEAARLYVQYMEESAAIYWTNRVQLDPAELTAGESAALEPVAIESGSRSRNYWQTARDVANNYITVSLLLSTLFMTILMLSMALVVPDWKRFVLSDGLETPSVEFVAKITRFEQTTWDEASDGNLMNRDLFVGDKLILKEGLIVIAYGTGAQVVIEGPANYTVKGTNGGGLQLGRLAARADTKESQGFAIDILGGRVEDLGTEFGVEVDENGAAEVVVLAGEVDLIRESSPGVVAERVRLVKDEGAFVANRGARITKRKKVDARFVAAMRVRLDTIVVRAPNTASANLIINGSFEITTLNPVGNRKSIPTGAGLATMPGWNIGSSHPRFYHLMSKFDAIGPRGGNNFINLTHTLDGGTLSQSFAVTAGAEYTVSWYARERGKNNHHEAQVTLGAGSVVGQLSLATSDLTTTRWKQFSFSFTPDTSTTATLTFSPLNKSGHGTYVDYVTVTVAATGDASDDVRATSNGAAKASERSTGRKGHTTPNQEAVLTT